MVSGLCIIRISRPSLTFGPYFLIEVLKLWINQIVSKTRWTFWSVCSLYHVTEVALKPGPIAIVSKMCVRMVYGSSATFGTRDIGFSRLDSSQNIN